jgi:hypothetical protein
MLNKPIACQSLVQLYCRSMIRHLTSTDKSISRKINDEKETESKK